MGWRSPKTKQQLTSDLKRLVEQGEVPSKKEAARLLEANIDLVSQIAREAGLNIPRRRTGSAPSRPAADAVVC